MGPFTASRRVSGIVPPPIAAVMDRVREMKASGRRVVSMAQAAPWYGPPETALAALAAGIAGPGISAYTPDEGQLSTRRAVTEDFRRRRGIDLDPSGEIHLTCGASQAFLGALLTVTDPGDRVLLVEPWYFDHEFAVRFGGLVPVSARMRAAAGRWVFPADEVESLLGSVRAVVIVNPGNPTGMVLTDGELQALTEACAAAGTFLLLDETYERFNFTTHRAHPWSSGRRPAHVLTFGSFSKSLGMPGWRLGYLFGEAGLLKQALKVQDSAVICPPAPAQALLELALPVEGWIEARAAEVLAARNSCRSVLLRGRSLGWTESDGAFFTMSPLPPGRNSVEESLRILDGYGLATIPGSAFGPAGEGCLRISFGCLAPDNLGEAMDLLGLASGGSD